MDFDEDKIRKMILAGLKNPEPWRVELEQINYGAILGVYYRGPAGISRVATETSGKNDEQIAFALLSGIMNGKIEPAPQEAATSPYEGKRGKHPRKCTCSKHKGLDGQQAA